MALQSNGVQSMEPLITGQHPHNPAFRWDWGGEGGGKWVHLGWGEGMGEKAYNCN